MNKQQLQQEIAELQKQLEEKQNVLEAMPDKWEPEGGEFMVSADGDVSQLASYAKCRLFGVEYATREQAEKAAKAMRAHNRLLAYVAEFASDYEFKEGDKNWYVYFDIDTGEWDCSYNINHKTAGVVYMSITVAGNLCRKLNSGEVEL